MAIATESVIHDEIPSITVAWLKKNWLTCIAPQNDMIITTGNI
jgi:hypothetical protein